MFFRLFLFLGLVLPLTAFSQTGVIRGTVRDPQGNRQTGILVRVIEESTIGTSTDESGAFQLTVPAGRPITLSFKSVGVNEKKISIELAPGEERVLDVVYDASLVAGPIEIFDQQNREEGIRIITTKLPSRLPVPNPDIISYLIQAPVNIASELSSSYSVRGGSFDENLIYVNDIQVYRPFLVRSGQQEGLSFPNPDMVSKIEFSAGGFAAKFGDKMSSVLDIQYNRPDSLGGTAQIGLLGAQLQLEGASKNKKFTFNTGVRHRDNSYVLNTLDVSGDYNPRFTDVQTYVTWRPGGAYGPWEIAFLGNYSNNYYNFVPETRQTDAGNINQALRLTVFFEGQEITRYQTVFGAISTRYNPSELSQVRFTLSAFGTREREYFDILGAYRLDELDRDLGSDEFGEVLRNRGVGAYLEHARNDLEATVYSATLRGFKDFDRTSHLIEYGADIQIESVYDKLNEWTLIDSAGYASPRPPDQVGVPNPAPAPETIPYTERIRAINDIQSSRISAFIQDTWSRELRNEAKLAVNAGIRANHWTFNEQTVFSPRVNLAYTPVWIQRRTDEETGRTDSVRKDIVIRAAVGYYYQPPFYREMRGFDGQVNPDIRAQRSIHYILGADYIVYAWGRPFKLITEAYYKQMTELIPYELENVRLRYFARNNAKGYATGLDVMMNGEFITGVQSWLRASVLKTEEDLLDDDYFIYLNASGDTIYPGFTIDDVPVDSIRQSPGYIPRPTDQRFSFSMLFLDEMPKKPWYKVMVNFFFATGLPYGPPSQERYLDVNRTRAYLRADVGFSRDLFRKREGMRNNFFNRNIERGSISVEIFNLLGVNNIINYQWIEDISGRQYGIPTYLTGRRINVRFSVDF